MILLKEKAIYTPNEVSKIIQRTAYTVRVYLRTGILKGSKILGKWYISSEDLYNFFTGGDIVDYEKVN